MKNNWKKCKIGDIGTVVGGSTPSTKDEANYNEGNISWITPKDLSNFNERYIFNGSRNITDKGLKNCSAQLMPKNSVLFTSRAPIGYVAIAGKELCTNQGFKSVIPNKDTDYMFLYYLLKFNKEYIESMGSGTTFKEVSGTTMKNIEVSVPPLTTQRQIAKILSSLDDKIELNNRINKNLEEQAMAIYKSWFVDKQYDYAKECLLGDICNCELGGTPSRAKSEYWNGSIPWINSGEVNNFRIIKASEYITEEGLQKSATKLLPPKTTVLAITGATLGQVSLLEIESCANQSVVGVIPNNNLPYEFIYPFINYNINEIISHQTGGAQQHINKQNIANLKIKIPSSSLIKSYKKIVSPIFEQIKLLCFENESITSLRDTLLPKLMNGEINTNNLNI